MNQQHSNVSAEQAASGAADSTPAVSIIVPMYNVERYLRQCLQSIQDQTLHDIEVLCINDGSTDGSADIAHEFAQADARFQYFDKPNGGYGQTVNFGLDRARGSYIGIVEPDDFLAPEMYAELLAAAQEHPEVDIVKGSYWDYYDASNGGEERMVEPHVVSHMPTTPTVFSLSEDPTLFRFHPSIWSALYRADFLRECGIRFIEVAGAGWADNPFFAETMVQAKRIMWVPKPYYYYRQTNQDSSSAAPNPQLPFDRILDMHSILERCGVNSDIWAAQYLRDFEYIRLVVAHQDLSCIEPDVVARIQQTIEMMDADIVRTHPMMLLENVRFYEDFLVRGQQALATLQNGERASLGQKLKRALRALLPTGR